MPDVKYLLLPPRSAFSRGIVPHLRRSVCYLQLTHPFRGGLGSFAPLALACENLGLQLSRRCVLGQTKSKAGEATTPEGVEESSPGAAAPGKVDQSQNEPRRWRHPFPPG
jgi:hypothetical protein